MCVRDGLMCIYNMSPLLLLFLSDLNWRAARLESCMSPVGCALGVTICHPAARLRARVLPKSPPINETAVDGEPWSAALTRITWTPVPSVDEHIQPKVKRWHHEKKKNFLPPEEKFYSKSSMAIRLVHALHVLLILESDWGKVMSEDLGEAVRHGADASPGAEERAFAHRGAARDMVSISMFKVYERYSKEPQSQRDGNTVRSFKAAPSE